MFQLAEHHVGTRGVNAQERRLRNEASLRRWTNFALLVAVAMGLAVALAHGGTVSASWTAYGAAIGMGAVLGFLFGVPGFSRRGADAQITPASNSETHPRPITSNASPANATADEAVRDKAASTAPSTAASAMGDPHGTPPPSPSFAGPTSDSSGSGGTSPASTFASTPVGPVPTTPAIDVASASAAVSLGPPSNLEQVADWVTKLLLGGGLTQMQQIPPLVWRWSRWVALGILGDEAKTGKITEQVILSHQAFAAGLLLYGFVLGFFGGFLITKLQLGRAISDI